MSEPTKIYLDFEGSVPEMDGVRECDWYFEIYGDPVTDTMVERLRKYITKVAKKDIRDDDYDYGDLCMKAEDFMCRQYGYVHYDEIEETRSIEVKV